jgi:hypothetical protein
VVSVLEDLSGERVFDRAIDDAGTAAYAISSSTARTPGIASSSSAGTR